MAVRDLTVVILIDRDICNIDEIRRSEHASSHYGWRRWWSVDDGHARKWRRFVVASAAARRAPSRSARSSAWAATCSAASGHATMMSGGSYGRELDMTKVYTMDDLVSCDNVFFRRQGLPMRVASRRALHTTRRFD